MAQQRATPPSAPSALGMLEDAMHLLRRAPLGSLGMYYIGALPLVLGALYFWADMAYSASAPGRLFWASGAMAAGWVWAKCWASLFMQDLLARLEGWPHRRAMGLRQAVRFVLMQAALQPLALWATAVSALLVLPLPTAWVMSHTACLLADGKAPARPGEVLVKSFAAGYERLGAHGGALAVLALAAIFVFANVLMMLFIPAMLAKGLLGVETAISRGGFELDAIFVAIAAALTYLCVGPLACAYAVVNWFNRQSAQTGADLLGRLRELARPAAVLLAALVLAGAAQAAGRADTSDQTQAPAIPAVAPALQPPDAKRAPAPAPAGQAGHQIDPAQLERSIQRVLSQDRYAWRTARQDAPEQSLLAPLATYVRELIDRLNAFIDRLWPRRGHSGGMNLNLGGLAKLLGILVGAVAAVLLVAAVARNYRRRGKPAAVRATAVADGTADLAGEDVSAQDRSTDEWLRLAQELMARGELRLALRAMFLSLLATLGQRRLLRLERYKSNREYLRELGRHAHATGGLDEGFAAGVRVFERSWYGYHEVTPAVIEGFDRQARRVRDAMER